MRVLESVYDRSSDDIATAVEMLLNHKHLILQDSETVPAAIDLFVHAPVSVFPSVCNSSGKPVICSRYF